MHIMMSPGRRIMGRLSKGDDLLLSIGRMCDGMEIQLAEVRAIGAVSCARVGYYDQTDRKYTFMQLDRPLEILSLMGNVSLKDGKPFVHAHITVSDEDGRAFGGHLAEGTMVFACEYTIVEYHSDKVPARHWDEETGLSLWPSR